MGKLLLLALVVLAVFIAGVVFGRLTRAKSDVGRSDRKELENLRNLSTDLLMSAAQHIALGDAYAAIVWDQITETTRERS